VFGSCQMRNLKIAVVELEHTTFVGIILGLVSGQCCRRLFKNSS